MSDSHHFYQLQPQSVLQAVESVGFRTTGQFTQLNSYENRVFDVVLEEEKASAETPTNLIVKFYRPGRWSREAILEEHQFLLELQGEGIHAVAPLLLPNGTSVESYEGLYFSLFPKVRGRLPQEFLDGELKQVGRTLARIHNLGSQHIAKHRPTLGADYYGSWDVLDELLDRWVSPELVGRYEEAGTVILEYLEENLRPESFLRIHGDCHKGNLLHNGQEFFFVDFDDFCNGPAVQDFWMLFSGGEEQLEEEEQILSGYEELRDFPKKDWKLIPALRGYRVMGYAGWIAKRWEDPSFPRLFQGFTDSSYWFEDLQVLEAICRKI